MDAALRKAGGLNEDDAELEAHEAEVARRGASTKAVAGAVLPEAARGGGRRRIKTSTRRWRRAPTSSRPREASGSRGGD